jgi:type I restriction enzyme, S subunit
MAELPEGTTFPRGLPALPNISWPLVPARELFELRYGKALVETRRRPGSIVVFGSNGPCGFHDEPLFKGPGVILGRKGQGPLGVKWSNEDYWVIDTAYTLKPLTELIDLRFSYYLISFIGLNHLKDGTSNPTLSREVFGSQAFPVPPIADQARIASALMSLDNKVALNNRMNETLEAMARAIFTDWFVDFGPTRAKAEGRAPYLAPEIWALFPNRLANGGKPEGWETRPLLDLCELKRGYDLPSQDRVTGEIPIMSSSGPTGWHNVAMAQTPGIVTGRYGTIGQVFTCHVDFWPLNTTLYVRDFKGHPFWFVYHVLSGLPFSKFTDKAAVPGINRNDLHREPVTFPTAELIAAFNAIALPLMMKVRSNDAESQILVSLRDLLIPKLMSGEIRVRDAEKVAEAAA